MNNKPMSRVAKDKIATKLSKGHVSKEHPCEMCHSLFIGSTAQKYCSRLCYYRSKHNKTPNWKTPLLRAERIRTKYRVWMLTPEYVKFRQRLSIRMKERIANGELLPPKFTRTKIHMMLSEMLLSLNYDIKNEVRVGYNFIDCYIPSLHLGFEADGKVFHDHNKDVVRDEHLLKMYYLPIIRISENDLKHNLHETKEKISAIIESYSTDLVERITNFTALNYNIIEIPAESFISPNVEYAKSIKGKTWEDIYGVQRASEMKRRLSRNTSLRKYSADI